MSDENVMTTESTAPSNEGQPGATVSQTAPSTEGQPVKTQEGNNISAPSNNTEGQPEKSEEALRREAGLLTKTQRELAEAQKQLERLKVIESKIVESPEKFKRALMDINDLSEAEANQIIERAKADGVWSQLQNQVVNNQPIQPQFQVDPYTAARQVIEEERFKDTQMQTINKLQETFSELAKPEAKQDPIVLETLNKADYYAKAKMQVQPNLSYTEAVLASYAELTGRTQEEIEKAKENGRIQGIAEANTVNGAKSNVTYSQRGKTTTGNPDLTDIERSYLRQVGRSEDSYKTYNPREATYVD